MSETPYQHPAGSVETELEIKRSRFITRLGRADSRAAAMAFVEDCRRRYPDARHVCWAFVAGNPLGGAEMGSHDAGEPAGTAGRPMLSVLEHKGLGDTVVVVIRYFGGIKLGAGGLVRAYGAAVQRALDATELSWREPSRELQLVLDFEHESLVRRQLLAHEAQALEVDYGERVHIRAQLPARCLSALDNELTQASSGRIEIKLEDESRHE
ncbi:YigZ family protein [Gammaproteobacteria bacterium AB-CW1]|uniref:YigZ family protein n=1 Tax=Natronospira elongata TaxID=3110268 RepID=A0AAP6JD83_9GAMM|nr:YigZ family protein [Gammaproteobacteria bacterium AB-CW1]